MAQAGGVFSIFESLSGVFGIGQSAFGQLTGGGGFSAALTQAQNELVPVAIPTPNQLIDLYRRQQITINDFYKFMKKNGVTQATADILLNGTTQLLGLVENIVLYRRNLLSKNSSENSRILIDNMTALGIPLENVGKILDAAEIQPTPQDLITFLVREVFNPDIVKKFGQDLEFPTKAIEEGFKIGLNEELLKKYWSAHWQLPDPNAVFEAMYRFAPDILDQATDDLAFLGLTKEQVMTDFDTVDTLLKTKDVMPYWRPRIRATAFNNLTRVDTRRMIRLRFISFKDAIYQYRKQGYTPKDAERLVKFGFVVESLIDWKDGLENKSITMDNIKRELGEWNITEPNLLGLVESKLSGSLAKGVEEHRKLTQSLILRAFNLGGINRTETIQMLIDLKYSEEQAKFILEVEELSTTLKTKPKLKELDLSKTDLLKGYKEEVFSRDDTKTRLINIGYSDAEASELLEIEDRKPVKEKKE